MNEPRTIIITGMSGAGKTQVVRSLEDLDYFCVDNLPPTLIPTFYELCRQDGSNIQKIALVVDIRGRQFFEEMVNVLDKFARNGIGYELLYLDADDNCLVKRFKETRRSHPFGGSYSLSAAISKERDLLIALHDRATAVIDTSNLSNTELRLRVMELFGSGDSKPPMKVMVESFGFKHGTPLDADMILDSRFLPNPYYVANLKKLNGNDQEVIDFLQEKPVTGEFIKKIKDLVTFLLPLYVQEGKSQFVLAVGCTGGHHRSVYIANEIAAFIKESGFTVEINHRDIVK